MTDSMTKGLLYEPSKATKGVGAWIIRYSLGTSRQKLVIGKYPAMGIEEARELSRNLLSHAKNGISPKVVIEANQNRIRQQFDNTFERITEIFYQEGVDKKIWKNDKFIEQWIREMRNHIFPTLGKMPISNIKAGDIKRALNDIWNTIPDTTSKLLQRISQVMDYGISLEYCESNPCASAKTALGKQKRLPESQRHFSSLEWQQVPLFIKKVILETQPSQGKRALLFLILNAARSGAVRNMAFCEVNIEQAIWTMPANGKETKTNEDIFYPLSKESLMIVKAQMQKKSSETELILGLS